MSFKTNEAQQISLNDAFLNLTERERKALENSWAEIFSEELFPPSMRNRSMYFILTKHPGLTPR